MLDEFKKFAMRGNVVDLAVGVVIGAAFGAIVNSLVGDIVMPIIGSVTGGLDFSNYLLPLSSKVTAGALAEYPPLLGVIQSPRDITAGPDGNLWFTEFNPAANKVAKITTSGTITEYPVPTAAAEPNASHFIARPSAVSNTSLRCAPRAMRIPNSRSLLLTEYAAIPKTPLIDRIALALKAQAAASLLLLIPERYHRINPASSP